MLVSEKTSFYFSVEFNLREYSSRHPSVSRDNGGRLGWFSVLFGAASGVAQQPNPGVNIQLSIFV